MGQGTRGRGREEVASGMRAQEDSPGQPGTARPGASPRGQASECVLESGMVTIRVSR